MALAIGLAAGAFAWWFRSRIAGFSDFDVMWYAARGLRAGRDPYLAAREAFHWPLHYPMPAVLLTLPFAWVPIGVATALWTALGFGVLAYVITARAWWPLITLASYPAVASAQLAQWSPLMTSAAFLPALGFFLVVKPTILAAIIGSQPGRYLAHPWLKWNLIAGLLLLSVSFVLMPDWLSAWRSSVESAFHFQPAITRPLGMVLLLAVVKWRRAEARLLVLLAMIPQSLGAYEALPLMLIPSNRREAMIFASLSFAAVPFLETRVGVGQAFSASMEHNAPVILVCLYMPALVMVLRRPNEGAVPVWIERVASRAHASNILGVMR